MNLRHSPALYPLEVFYGTLSRLEAAFFRRLSFLRHRSPVPIISVGNLTMGGTGKTPVLLEILDRLTRAGKRPAVITRGYRSPWERSFYFLAGPEPHPPQITDEALLVNRHFPKVPVILGKNRAHSVRMATILCSPDVFVLDDGFQYRRLERSSDLVLWDAAIDPTTEYLLPRGNLREPFSRLADAKLILLTRCETVPPEQIPERTHFLSQASGGRPVIRLHTTPCDWIDPTGHLLPLSQRPDRAVAFAAIGSPDSFLHQLRQSGVIPIDQLWFRDHHAFTDPDLEALGRRARELSARLVCTEKDRVKIPPAQLAQLAPFALRIKMHPVDPDSDSAFNRAIGLP